MYLHFNFEHGLCRAHQLSWQTVRQASKPKTPHACRATASPQELAEAPEMCSTHPDAAAPCRRSPNTHPLDAVTFTTFPDARMTMYPWMTPASVLAPKPPLDTAAITCQECKRVILAFSLDSHRLWCPGEPVNLAEEMGAANGITARGLPKRAAAVARNRTASGPSSAPTPAEAARAVSPPVRKTPSRSASAGGGGRGGSNAPRPSPALAVMAEPPSRSAPTTATGVRRKPRASPLCNVATAAPPDAVTAAEPHTARSSGLHRVLASTPRKRRSARMHAPCFPAFLPFKDDCFHPASAAPLIIAGSKRMNWRASRMGAVLAKRPLHGDSGEHGLPGLELGSTVAKAPAPTQSARLETQVLFQYFQACACASSCSCCCRYRQLKGAAPWRKWRAGAAWP
jgi:hypothetical protein